MIESLISIIEGHCTAGQGAARSETSRLSHVSVSYRRPRAGELCRLCGQGTCVRGDDRRSTAVAGRAPTAALAAPRAHTPGDTRRRRNVQFAWPPPHRAVATPDTADSTQQTETASGPHAAQWPTRLILDHVCTLRPGPLDGALRLSHRYYLELLKNTDPDHRACCLYSLLFRPRSIAYAEIT